MVVFRLDSPAACPARACRSRARSARRRPSQIESCHRRRCVHGRPDDGSMGEPLALTTATRSNADMGIDTGRADDVAGDGHDRARRCRRLPGAHPPGRRFRPRRIPTSPARHGGRVRAPRHVGRTARRVGSRSCRRGRDRTSPLPAPPAPPAATAGRRRARREIRAARSSSQPTTPSAAASPKALPPVRQTA